MIRARTTSVSKAGVSAFSRLPLAAALLMLASLAHAQDQPNLAPTITWKYSVASLAVAHALDIVSSTGSHNGTEQNSLLTDDQGRFAVGKAAFVKGGIAGGGVMIQWLVVRKWPRTAKYMALFNFTESTLTSAIAAHNFTLRK